MVEMVFSIVPKQRLAGKTFRAEDLEEQGQGAAVDYTQGALAYLRSRGIE